ncbi:ABC transporter ATP-binding protein [Pseudonocardia kujensis]|uniref:ABC transporter ATP-binding protein n=1 Tax=Pseudonocardia kujensis TaxID=1128675 RepID=UPI001E510DD5|nr:ABC transporter ATP-binding protein [Pseudonocardia kujensis]MCE0763695.1 ABC transporter ATP-binding protein [Pseudonocardia kujensis]
MSAQPLIRSHDVTRRFGAVEALGPLSLHGARGEFVSIVGPSGCGKSTMLEIVGGLQRPDSGSVFVAGVPLEGPRDETAIVFQDSATLPWRTVLDNVAFSLEARGVARDERRDIARRGLETVGLAAFAAHYPAQLSGGMRQRVALARALVTEPDLILADEPFGALDEQTRLLMSDELLAVVDRLGCGVLFITHSIQEAVLLSDRILVMSARPGRIVDEITVPLERPRTSEVLSSTAAAECVSRIWALIRREAQVAMQGAS